jgi:hypothetical protein
MPKMTSHEPFGHLKPKLWAKEGPGVKLAIWFPTTKSRESTSSRCCLKECDIALESSQRELQLWFKPRPDLSLGQGATSVQSLGTPTRDSFETLTWESREKEPRRRAAKYTIWGKVVASPESRPWWVLCVKMPVACPNTQGCSRMQTNLLVVGFGCRFKLDYLVPLPILIPGLLACPSTPF